MRARSAKKNCKITVFVRPRPFSQKLTPGFRQSQASLIWRELEEEEEGFDEGARGLFRSGLQRRRQTQRNREEDQDRAEGPARRRNRWRRMSDYPDDDCVRYFILGTLAAAFALIVNLVYPLIYKSNWT